MTNLTPILDSIDLDNVLRLKQEADALANWTKFAEQLAHVFSHLNCINASFLKTNRDAQACPVDKVQAREALATIKKGPILLISTIAEQAKQLLNLFIHKKSDISPLDQFNLMLILFQCPAFLTDGEFCLLSEISDVLANLCEPHQDQFFQFLIESQPPSTDCVTQFKEVLHVFQQFVSKRLLSRSNHTHGTSGFSPNSDVAVMDATKCISILYRLNENKQYVSYTEFYNDAVNDQLEIKEDFPNFKDKKGFSFCDYPFMLNPAVKADVLKVESVFQMRHELQDAFFRALFQGVNSPYLVLEIRRDHIISDTLLQLEEKSIHDLKKQLRVQFVGEEGVDEGGVQKEFFQLIVREIFDPKYGMFTFNEESRLCWFTPNPVLDEINIREYKLVGLLLGLAVYNSVILDLHFPLVLYKKLMQVNTTLSDLKQLDPSLGKGLERLLNFEGDIVTEYDRNFQVDIQSFGHVYTCDLKPFGSNIQLTNENKHEFVDLYVQFVLTDCIEKQFNAFKEGFQLVCQDSAIKIFRPEEVEQLICGSSDLDFDALEASTVYDGGWSKDSDIIKYFWEIVHSFTYEEKKKLLFFATGSDRAPIGGLGKLQFVIAKNGGDSDRLPTSHTCYNVLLLCEYSSKEKLKERLLTSISNAEGFGMI
ncbi:hypothetical protein EDC96DRAFT_500434, partial [Choanephora cucurbitarum]